MLNAFIAWVIIFASAAGVMNANAQPENVGKAPYWARVAGVMVLLLSMLGMAVTGFLHVAGVA